jgi:hypothetical protein
VFLFLDREFVGIVKYFKMEKYWVIVHEVPTLNFGFNPKDWSNK